MTNNLQVLLVIGSVLLANAAWLSTLLLWRRSAASWRTMIANQKEISDEWRALTFEVLDQLSEEKRAAAEDVASAIAGKTLARRKP